MHLYHKDVCRKSNWDFNNIKHTTAHAIYKSIIYVCILYIQSPQKLSLVEDIYIDWIIHMIDGGGF